MLSKNQHKVKVYSNHNLLSAFSLLEVSIILMIAGLLISGYVTWVAPAQKSNAFKFTATQIKMQDITEAIERFTSVYGRLPCPADPTDPFGETGFFDENLLAGVCNNSIGALPTGVLGLTPDMQLDAWGKKFTYATAPNLCGPLGCSASSFTNGTTPFLTIQDTTPTTISTNAAYVLISHGPAGRGAFRQSGIQDTTCTVDEADNCDFTTPNTVFRQNALNNNFQHLVFYRNLQDLNNLTIDPNIRLVELETCLNNSTQIANINLTNATVGATSIRSVITGTTISSVHNNANGVATTTTYNQSDEAVLDVMWNLQEACYILYPTEMPAVKACPGGATYDANDNSCVCANGTWNGAC